jgi:large subunit ribosomal protein L21
MYAIIRTGGKQFRVAPGQTLRVPSLAAETGAEVELETLLMAGDDGVQAGAAVGEVKTVATVVGHGRGEKIIVFKKKRRKQYKRKQGHRQGYTEIQIAG